MTTDEIVRALRCCVFGAPCGNCLAVGNTNCVNDTHVQAAALIEQLNDLTEQLNKEIEWKDMVIALAQREQAKAEAERDALLALMKAHRACYACKRADCCNGSNADVVDCMLCTEVACPCVGCRDSSRWEWRGLPEPEEGEKA